MVGAGMREGVSYIKTVQGKRNVRDNLGVCSVMDNVRRDTLGLHPPSKLEESSYDLLCVGLYDEPHKKWRSVMKKEYERWKIHNLDVKKMENEEEITDDYKDDSIKPDQDGYERGHMAKLLKFCGENARQHKVKISNRNPNQEIRNNGDRYACLSSEQGKGFFNLLVLVTIIGLLKVVSPVPLYEVLPVTSDDEVNTFIILVTNLCSLTSFNRSQTCQTNDFQLDETIKHCGFQALCISGYQARCINTQEGGMAHICVEINISCEAGVWRKAWVDKQNKSVIRTQDQECQNDKFQPVKSNCFDACQKEHLDLNELPERYLVYSKGDNKSPTYVYCNYKKGYVNPSNKTLLNYDLESQYNQLFCMNHKNIDLRCEDNEIILPNSTCVSECKTGECRDDHDQFICKQNCSLNGRDVDSQEKSTEQNKGGKTKLPETTTEIKGTEQSPKDKKSDTIHIIIISLSVILSAIIIATSIVLVVKCRNRTDNAPFDAHGRGLSSIDDGNLSGELLESKSGENGITTNGDDDNSSTSSSTSSKTDHRKERLYTSEHTETKIHSRTSFNNVQHVSIHYHAQNPGQIEEKDGGHNIQMTGIRNHENNDKFEETRKKEFEDVTEPLLAGHTHNDQNFEDAAPNLSNGTVLYERGDRLKKDVDDTFTPSVMNSLSISAKSCGALIYDGNLMGTVFRVGEKYVMTAYHVIQHFFDQIQISSDRVFVNFAESVCDNKCRTYTVKHVLNDEYIDVAILELVDGDKAEDLPPPLMLWHLSASDLNIGDITVVGYGHENNPYKKHVEKCKILTDHEIAERVRLAENYLQQRNDEFEEDIRSSGKDGTSISRGYSGYNTPHTLKFDCYMTKGLSGGPMLTNDSNSVKVIGMVIGMKPEIFFNLSPAKQEIFPKKFRFEFGIKMETVYKRLKLKNRNLAKEIFPPTALNR